MSLETVLSKQFPALTFQYDFPLAAQTYFKIGGPAEAYIELNDKKQVAHLAHFCREKGIAVTMLGGASNVVIADEGISGVVIHLTNDQVEDLRQTMNTTKHLIRAGAGVKMALLVKKSVDLGYTGLEYFLGVPGTLGGAVYNNAHYLEDLISKHIHRVEIIDDHGTIKRLHGSECQFEYDTSRFQRTKEIILGVDFALELGNAEKSQELIREATLYRAQTQPLGEPSSGCIFQNTPNTPALRELFPQFRDRNHVPGGFLIDQAGLKGERVGDVVVSDKHAAFMINKGQGTAAQFQELVERVKLRVKEQFGVELHEEVFYLR